MNVGINKWMIMFSRTIEEILSVELFEKMEGNIYK